MTKAQYRKTLLAKRNSLSPETVYAFEAEASCFFMASSFANQEGSLMLYSSFGNEAGTGTLISALYNRGTTMVLPKTKGGDIVAYVYDGPDCLTEGVFGILEPDENKCSLANLSEIKTVIVPGVAFDKTGARTGFGKGYYDRFLPKLSKDVVKIGLCYDFQIVEEGLPSEAHDVSMDLLLTEKGFFDCKTQRFSYAIL